MKLKIAVTDACIFIDLFDLDLVNAFFQLEIDIHTTTSVYFELFVEQQQVLTTYQSIAKLLIHNLKEEDYLQIQSEPYPKSLSQTDKSVLHIAKRLNACVLSSDKTVRNFAKNKGIEYHGMIWVFDMLVESAILTNFDAAIKLQQLVTTNFIYQNNKPLVEEIQKRLMLWGDSN
ncbi:PIN domain-containing protein [Sphingobacterium humi]|uniref:PIN domain-containing protein n=1 Tax=Sphingobacterium humi TaxID=1796905 RepID=A0A6N8KTW0_9SPHI|nr:PIN domain-containing protein [Sphingobacterium humi]MVZ60893.1 hypothetical protein [Sphingobacterium humi]